MSGFNIDFAQLTASGSTKSEEVTVDGEYAFYGDGTFGGGTLTFQVSVDGTNWIDLATGITANGRQRHALNAGELVRANLAGATSPALDVYIR